MKYLISSLSFILFIGLFTVSAQSDESTVKNDNTTTLASEENPGDVQVYYFHATRRCATCEAVEAVSKEALTSTYGDKVAFESINREEEKSSDLVEKYKISGTALLVVSGDKVVDLTNEAFLNARSKPDKLKSKLKSTIDSMM